MSGNNIPRQPAKRVGGQRRRLSRLPPSGVPRSRTLPVLHGDPGSGSAGPGVGQEPPPQEGATATHHEEGAPSLEASQSMMNFYAPAGGLADLRDRDNSPTPTSESTSTTAADSKKKHGIGNPFRSKPAPPLQAPPSQTPLPPATPTKAAKLLGLDPESPYANSVPVHQNSGALDSVNEERPRIKQGWPQKHTAPVPKASINQSTSSIFYENIETDDDDEPPKSKGFFHNSKKTAKKMSGSLRDLFTSPSRPNFNYSSLPSINDASPDGLYTNFVDSIGFPDFDRPARPTEAHHEPPRPVPKNDARLQQVPPKTISKHRAKKEQAKDQMKKMGPVTEASRDSMSAPYQKGEDNDNSEIDLIDEYATDRRSDPIFSPPRSESLMPHTFGGPYTLTPADMLPFDQVPEQEMVAEEEESFAVHPGTPVQTNKPLPALRRRSPLQVVEDRFLDVAEQELEAKQNMRVREGESTPENEYSVYGMPVELSKAKPIQQLTPFELQLQKMRIECDINDAKRIEMDKQVAAMKERHEQFKKDFGAYQALANGSEIVEDDDHVSIRSSIDLDEEPTLHVARAVTITRVTPGMVKLVDIPARKKKDVA